MPNPVGYQQITSLSASTALTVPTPAIQGGLPVRYCLIQCDTQNVRWRDDGTAPTATVGMLLIASTSALFYDGDLAKIRFIEVASAAKLNISYYQ